MVGIIEKIKIKNAFSGDKPNLKKAREHAQKAKGLLKSHKSKKKKYHNKIAIRVDN
jgi:hypothetical protein